MRFIHTGDIHLGAAPDSLMPWSLERRGEIRDTFMRLLEEVRREKTDLLLIAGDLFHRQPLKKELREEHLKESVVRINTMEEKLREAGADRLE